MMNVFQPSLGEDELAAVEEVFRSNWLGRGSRVSAFEEGFAGLCGVEARRMVATTCATEGLFTAAAVLGWGAGDEVIVPSISFVAAGSCVASVGARPVFSDVDARTLNAGVEHLEAVRTSRTRAVLLNHYGGHPAPVAEIAAWCEQHGLQLVEDAACAVAAQVSGRGVGTFGDIGVWSFDSMKVLVTGDGGMVYVRDPDLELAVRRELYLGLPVEEKSGLDRSQGMKGRWWEYELESFGRRAIMNDVTAAIGLVQLRRLQCFVRRRAEIARRYDDALGDLDGLLTPPPVADGVRPTEYLYWIQLERERDALAQFLLEQGVYTTFRYWPLHRVRKLGHDGSALPNADRAAATTLNLPCHQALTDADVDRVIDLVRQHLRGR